jgi:hypothetical protein
MRKRTSFRKRFVCLRHLVSRRRVQRVSGTLLFGSVILLLFSATPHAVAMHSPLGVAASSHIASAHTPTWHRVGVTSSIPVARFGSAMAYDVTDGYLVLFGGQTQNGSLLADTWTYHNATWSKLAIVGPSPRTGAAMVYDGAKRCLILFGGMNRANATSVFLNDTWCFAGGKWTLLHPLGAPPARSLALATYDPPARSVFIGGGHRGSFPYNFTDMWAFKANNWTNVPVWPRQPFDGGYSAMTYDARDGYPAYFGGSAGFGGNATWTYTGGNWTQLTPRVSPPASYWMALAWDPSIRKVVMFGVDSGISFTSSTWLFAGGVWTNHSRGLEPGARQGASMAFDASDGYVLLFGGYPKTASGTFSSATWQFS